MCNHYSLKYDSSVIDYAAAMALDDVMDEADSEPWTAVNDVRPWDAARLPVVYQLEAGNTLGFMRWGVWPFYEKSRPKNYANTCNARDDSLLAKPVWKRAAARGRCLVPADGFFEWVGPAGTKWEVLFRRPDESPFFFAGVWSRDPVDGGRGFAIVTTRPNPLVAALPHDRMPVILDWDAAEAWIGREPLPDNELLALCRPYPGDLVRVDQPRPDPKPRKITRADIDAGGELPLD